MTADPRKAAALQEQGTREFDEAVAGKGPAMPPRSATAEEGASLDEALKQSFPASDPAKPAGSRTGLGAPSGRKSVD
ncbi:hypothetical protein [Phreatobacter sp.]|uniref:hypothetical protein n=1 Tax=Phreatobacter sp. TaxID=1966341 RepID=UPI003F727076